MPPVSVTRKLVGAFGMIFKDIEIREWDDVGNDWKNKIKVPISYGPKDKWLSKVGIRQQSWEGTGSGFDDDIAITLPRIAFELTGINYDATRALNKKNFFATVIDNDGNKMTKQYVGVPYDYNFDVYIVVKYVEHVTKIIEQILPFFTPELNVSLKLTGAENITMDVPIIIGGISVDDQYEYDFTTRRQIIWTLNFTMKAYTFAEPKEGNIIKKAITGLGLIDTEGKSIVLKDTIIPTLQTKTLDEILSTDDYGFLETKEYTYE